MPRSVGERSAHAAIALLLATPLAAQVPDERASALIQRALARSGTPAAIAAADGLTLSAEGVVFKNAEVQGYSADSASQARYEERITVSGELDRAAREYREERFDGTWEQLREIHRPEHQRLLFLPSSGAAFLEVSSDAGRRRLLRRLPPFLLAEALRPEAAARLVGARDGMGIVAIRTTEGDTLELHIEEASGLLAGVDIRTELQGIGAAVIAWRFAEYRAVGDIGMLPHAWSVMIADRPFAQMRATRLEPGADAELLALPAGVREPEPRVVPANPVVTSGAHIDTVAPGVYVVRSLRPGFHPMFIEFADFVMAIDAPAGYRLLHELPPDEVAPGPSSAWLSEEYLDFIERTIPGKPVRFAVITHFHGDHAGGVRAFVARGARVVATRPDTASIRAVVNAPHRTPDALSGAAASLILEPIAAQRTISDGERTVHIIDTGPNPHTQAMLVVHLQEERILFVSDLLDGFRADRSPAASHESLDRWFARWLEQAGLDVETIHTMHGTGVVSAAQLSVLR